VGVGIGVGASTGGFLGSGVLAVEIAKRFTRIAKKFAVRPLGSRRFCLLGHSFTEQVARVARLDASHGRRAWCSNALVVWRNSKALG
jgi:hypothetical protein